MRFLIFSLWCFCAAWPAFSAQKQILGVEVVSSAGGVASNLTLRGSTAFTRFAGPSATNIVQVAPYDSAAAGAGNIGPIAGETSYEWLGYAHHYRVRQNGSIVQVRFYTAALTGVTAINVKVWRKDGTTYDLVATSANLLSSVTASSLNSVTVSLAGVQEGDFIGGRITYSAASAQVLRSKAVASGTTYSVVNSTPASTDFDWEGQTAAAGVIVPIECSMAAPFFIAIGDSIMSGRIPHISFADFYQDVTSISSQMPYSVGRALGYTYQNLGISGQTIGQVASRFVVDVVGAAPQFVILEGGVNDLLGGGSVSSILTAYTNCLSACTNATPPIVPVICGILPFRTYGGGGASDTASADADTINATLAAMAANYSGIFVDPSQLGIFYSAGAAGNKWKLNPDFDGGDGIHLSARGQAAWANLVLGALSVQSVKGGMDVGGSLSVRQDMVMGGDNNRVIGVARSTNYHGAGGSLRIHAGGSVGGVANLNGGDTVIESGTATGTGTSKVSISTPLLGTSGTTDNVASEALRVESITTAGARYASLVSSGGPAVYRVWDGASYKGGSGYSSSLGVYGFFGPLDGDNPVMWITPNSDLLHLQTLGDLFVVANAGAAHDVFYRCYNNGVFKAGFGFKASSGLIGLCDDSEGTIPKLWIQNGTQAGGFSGSNSFTIAGGGSVTKLIVDGPTSTTNQASAQMTVGNGNQFLLFGYNTNLDFGVIGAINNGVAHTAIHLGPINGDATRPTVIIKPGQGLGSFGTNSTMAVTATGATNSTGVNQIAWVTAATGLQLYNNAGTAVWSGTQNIAALTPIMVQPGGKFIGTSISSAGAHAL